MVAWATFQRLNPLGRLSPLSRLKNFGLGVGTHGITMLKASGTKIDFFKSGDLFNFTPTSSNNRPNGPNGLNRPTASTDLQLKSDPHHARIVQIAFLFEAESLANLQHGTVVIQNITMQASDAAATGVFDDAAHHHRSQA